MADWRLAHRYRFYPTPEQKQELAKTFGCCRYIYNWALALKSTAYKEHQQKLSYNDLSKALTALKKDSEHQWLNEVSSVALQQTLRHLDRGFTNFFVGRARYPQYRRRSGRQSAEYTRSAFTYEVQEVRKKNGKVFYKKVLRLAKMKQPLRVVWSRPMPYECRPTTVTVSRDPTGRYFVSLFLEKSIVPHQENASVVGLDLGLKALVVTSDGQFFGNPHFFLREERKLARYQRRLSRKKKGSKNAEKARHKVAKVHAKIADRRRDYQQKLSTTLVRQYGTIVVEGLRIKNMIRNRSLSKAIADVGWGELLRQLEYKSAWHQRTLVRVDAFFPSSKTCSACGHVVETLPLDIRTWLCPLCGTQHDRDVNAARSVKQEGLRLLAHEPLPAPLQDMPLAAEAELPVVYVIAQQSQVTT